MKEYEGDIMPEVKNSGPNFIRGVGFFHPFSAYYFYIDKDCYLADSLFEKYNIKVRFIGEYTRDDFPEYVIIKCKVRKKYDLDFQKAMKQLHGKMLVLNSPTYRKACNVLSMIMEEELRGDK